MNLFFLIFSLFILRASLKEEAKFGLRDKNGTLQIPLKHIEFNLNVADSAMSVEIVQTYHNSYEHAIDALYIFPVNYKMAVTNFTIWYSSDPDSILQSVILPKHISKKIYENATKEGHGAAHLEYDEKQMDLLSIALGNILPGVTVKATITFVEKLEVEDLSWAIRIPTTFTPRYHSTSTGRPAPDSATTPQVSGKLNPYTWSLNLNLYSSEPITRLISTSHKIVADFNPTKKFAYVTLKNMTEVPDRDIVILYRNYDIHKPHVILQKSPMHDTYAMLVSFLPFSESKKSIGSGIDLNPNEKYHDSSKYFSMKKEFILLLDCSGSMSGNRIEQSKEAAKIFLKSLPSDSYFNVILFGSTYKAFFPEASVKYVKEAIKETLDKISVVDANLGGTEIFPALNYAISMPPIEGHSRAILIMTDGEVSNAEEVINLVKSASMKKESSFHSIGIGSGASRHLVQGVAEAGNGMAYFLTDGEAIMPKVIEALGNMNDDYLRDLSIEWPNGSAIIISNFPKIGFYGKSVVGSAIFSLKPEGIITIKGKVGKEKANFEEIISLASVESSEGNYIYQLALKEAFIKGTLDESLIEKLSSEYSVLAEETGFVAVKIYDKAADRKAAETIRIPVVTVRDSESNLVENMLLLDFSAKHATPRMKASVMFGLQEHIPSIEAFDREEDNTLLLIEDPKERNEKLSELIQAQEIDGFFHVNDSIITKYFNRNKKEIKSFLSPDLLKVLSNDHEEKVYDTLLMLYLLDTQFSDQKQGLALIRDKSVSWLVLQGVNVEEALKDIGLALNTRGKKADL